MIAGLERFVEALRRQGIAASPAEWLDALRAAEVAGLHDRERFRQALRCALVKRASQLACFDATFDAFFVGPGRGGPGRERSGRHAAASARGRRSAPTPPDEAPPAERPVASRPQETPPDRESLAREIAAVRDGAPRQHGRLRRVIVAADAPYRAPREAAAREAHAADLPLERVELARTLSFEQEAEIARGVRRVVERIRLRSGRRLRRSPRGRLDLRRLFRDNLAHGGVPWILPRRRVRPRRSRVVLLIDVSWSTARAAGLFLSVAGEILRRARDTRVLLFVDRAVDATAVVEAWLARPAGAVPPAVLPVGRRSPGEAIVRGGVSFASVVRSLRGLNLDAPSDYGRVFHALARSPMRPTGRGTALVVLGDGRTNRFDPQDWAFEELAARSGAVLWLVPEPVERWGSGDSALAAWLPQVDVAVEAADLRGLSRGVAELVRRL